MRLLTLALILAPLGACAAAARTSTSTSTSTSTATATATLTSTANPSCLSIVAWNDLHGQLLPDTAVIDTGPIPVGGIVALADQIAAVRATGDVVVTLDAGDLFTGPLQSTLAEGAPVIAAYDAIGVDAVAIGNHEFDFGPIGYARVTAAAGADDSSGPDGPRGALVARMNEAHFPFLSANIAGANGASPTWPKLARSTHVRRGGFDVGVVGYTTRDTPTTTVKPNIADLDFVKDAAARVAAEVRKLRAEGAFPVVLLAHASLEGELPERLDSGDDPNGDKRVGEIAALLDGVGADKPDLVVGGHRHAWAIGRVRGVPFVTSDQHGVGLTRVRYCKGAGSRPALEAIERRVAIPSHPPASALGVEVEKTIAPWLAEVQSEADQPVATIAKLCAYRALDGTALGEQIARAIVAHSAEALPAPKGVPVVGVVNTGGIRAAVHPGPMRFEDLFAVTPFENQVAVCATTRAGLTRALRNAAARPAAREAFPFGIAGAKATFTRRADGALDLVRVDIDGDNGKRSDGDPVWLTIPDFLLWGGDGFLDGVTCTSRATSTRRLREAWRELISREQACDGPPKNVVIKRP
jgi:5'-nucleotidase